MNKRWKSTVFTGIVMLIVIFFVTTGYSGISRNQNSERMVETTDELSRLLSVEYELQYPATAKEVVKNYLKIMSCWYKEELKPEEFEHLVQQSYVLFDDALKEENPYENYISQLKSEIKKYKDMGRVISRYELEQGSSVEYYRSGASEYAAVSVLITARDEEGRYQIPEKFTLRKDKKDQYHIIGWEVVSETVSE